MRYSLLGRTGLRVSRACLGTMTWGTQNTQADADAQIEYALDHGVNFIDTAEMYAVPPSKDTYGSTERIIGNWIGRNPGRRGEFILATKIAGNGLSWIRQGGDITGAAVEAAVEQSLQRLQTDTIDLYQLHWPNRTSPHFGKHWPGRLRFSDVDARLQSEQMLDILQGLDRCIRAGKIRHAGLSDDTPWGIREYLKLSEAHGLPRIASIQNEFSLLHHKDWPYLIETCVHDEVAYLPWSPLAGGALSGKYLGGARPAGSRWSLSQRHGLFRDNPRTEAAIAALVEVAAQFDVTPAQLALAWCDQVDGVTSTIIGATSLAQLEENLAAFERPLTVETVNEIHSVLRKHPSPF